MLFIEWFLMHNLQINSVPFHGQQTSQQVFHEQTKINFFTVSCGDNAAWSSNSFLQSAACNQLLFIYILLIVFFINIKFSQNLYCYYLFHCLKIVTTN